jgi:mono/diheme cytochrome c family protein
MGRFFKFFLSIVLFGTAVFWWLTKPETIHDGVREWIAKPGDIAKGEMVFWAGGCASCHSAKDATGADKLKLGGDHALVTPVGTFNVPNISPDKENGIGSWSIEDFANAMLHGTSPEGNHYYPAFPYTSYAAMSYQDVKHLWTYLQTLEPVTTDNKPHDLSFPFNISRGIGLWKLMYQDFQPVLPVGNKDTALLRGRELVETLGHCGECHTPRSAFGYGGMDVAKWLSGGPAPEGPGKIPNITPHENGIGSWSQEDIVYYLESGFTPDYDSVGGTMVDVQQNMSKLPKSDLEAIAAYLKSVPAVPSN